jgi:hypothetical protein
MALSSLTLILVIVYAILMFSDSTYKNKFAVGLIIALLCFTNLIVDLLLKEPAGSFIWLFNTTIWTIITYKDYKKINE